MQTKKIITYFILCISTLLKCELPTESEPWFEEKYSYRFVDTDGKNIKVLREETGNGGSLYFISDDTEILILSSDSFFQMDLDSNDVKFVYRRP